MEINNNDNDESRRAEQKREAERHNTERKQKTEAVRTFEAKLSEKAAHEIASKDSQSHHSRNKQGDAKEKENLLEKIIGAVAKEQEEAMDRSRIREKKQLAEHDEDRHREEKHESKLENRRDEEHERVSDRKSGEAGDKKKSEISEEGYRRVAEKQDAGGEGGGGAQSGTGDRGQDSGGGGSFGSGHSGSGDNPRDGVFAKDLVAKTTVRSLTKANGTHKGFQQNSRSFTERNMDDIVSRVEVGLNAEGEEFFAVELSDPYFDGLKVEARRTDVGVVVRFHCPNISVRSTFIKYRPALYAHFKAKNVSVSRIDIV